MAPERLGFFARLWMAFILPWRLIFDGALAARVSAAAAGEALPAPEPAPDALPADIEREVTPLPEPEVDDTEAEAVEDAGPDPTPALQLLAILQREGRFIDFLQEDVSAAGDADVGAAARVVHEGCKRALERYLSVEPVRSEAEGSRVTLDPGFDAARNQVTGNVVGEPPFTGELVHPGWKATALTLPTTTAGHDASILAPAEIEL